MENIFIFFIGAVMVVQCTFVYYITSSILLLVKLVDFQREKIERLERNDKRSTDSQA
jgi:hypothetical protein